MHGASPPDSEQPGLSHKALLTLWLTVCLDMVGFGIILPVLPFHAERFGASPAMIAWLAGAFSVAQFIAAPVLGRIGDRIGRRPVLLLSIAGSCASMLMLALADSLALLFVARLLSGLSGANVAAAQAYVVDHVGPEERAKSLGRVGSAIGVGFVLGPVLGGLLTSPDSPALPFWIAAAASLANLALAFAWLPERRRERARPRAADAPRPARSRAVTRLIAINLGVFVAFAAMESTFALLLAARFDWGAFETGLVFALIGVTIVLGQGLLVGAVVRRIAERNTLRLGLLTLAAGLAGLGLGQRAIVVIAAACVVALGNALISPALHALLSRRSDPDRQGANLGAASAAGSLGRVLGPAGAGVAFEALGPGWPALIGAAIVIGLVSVGPRR